MPYFISAVEGRSSLIVLLITYLLNQSSLFQIRPPLHGKEIIVDHRWGAVRLIPSILHSKKRECSDERLIRMEALTFRFLAQLSVESKSTEHDINKSYLSFSSRLVHCMHILSFTHAEIRNRAVILYISPICAHSFCLVILPVMKHMQAFPFPS